MPDFTHRTSKRIDLVAGENDKNDDCQNVLYRLTKILSVSLASYECIACMQDSHSLVYVQYAAIQQFP